jgi:hypothetical protein
MAQDNLENKINIALRPAHQVMRLSRMGAFHQCRLSFMRVLLRQIKQQHWRFERPIWHINEQGTGVATYSVTGPDRTYTLIAFAHDLPDSMRSDRVIATAWDATFTLFDGIPDEADIARLSRNVPLQEAGRISESELTLSRANRSVRLFDYVIEQLSQGKQPDTEQLEQVGYLMRTTAVYGSAKFGAADRAIWSHRPEFAGSFRPELLAVWLIRTFSIDWVEHLARVRGGAESVSLDVSKRRLLGVGNSTGLGMAPFLINHPRLIHSWVFAREKALALVRSVDTVKEHHMQQFKALLQSARHNADSWHTDHPIQGKKLQQLRIDLETLSEYIDQQSAQGYLAWDQLYRWAEENLGLEAQEQLVSLLIEPYGELVDHLAGDMQAGESRPFEIDGSMSSTELVAAIEEHYQWALDIDFTDQANVARVWYVSKEKLEPRLGERFEEPIEDYEQPLAPGRDVAALYKQLIDLPAEATVAEFLYSCGEHRNAIRRVQLLRCYPYAEVRDNTIDAQMQPIDLLRCKLSFFGATRFDPRSDRWVRITMFKGAPYPDELENLDPDQLIYLVGSAA